MKRIIASVLIPAIISTASVSSADPPTAQNSVKSSYEDAVIMPMRQGQVALFPGLLFSPKAAATVATEISTAKEKLQIEVDTAVKEAEAKKDFRYNELNTICLSDKSRYMANMEANQKRIEDLETRLKTTQDKSPNSTMWFGLGAGTGVVVSLLTVFVVVRMTK